MIYDYSHSSYAATCIYKEPQPRLWRATKGDPPVLPVSSARTPRTLMPRTYVQPWARYAVITASSGVMAASMPTQHASCIYTADTTVTFKISYHSSYYSFQN